MYRTLDACRDAASLAHAVPGVSLRLRCDDGDDDHDVLVSASCIAAPLDPCQFRNLVVAAVNGRLAALARLAAVEVVGGAFHLGAGLYQPSHPGASDDRWFVTSLGHVRLTELLADCPVPGASGDAFSIVVKPDRELGRSAVRVRCDDRSAAAHVDEVALWATSACLVEELAATLADEAPIVRRELP